MNTNQGTRSSSIRIASRSVCDEDQNRIKQLIFLLGADQGNKTNSWATNINILSDTTEAWQCLCPLTPVKSSNQEPQKGTIKRSGTISPIKILDPGRISTVIFKWLCTPWCITPLTLQRMPLFSNASALPSDWKQSTCWSPQGAVPPLVSSVFLISWPAHHSHCSQPWMSCGLVPKSIWNRGQEA